METKDIFLKYDGFWMREKSKKKEGDESVGQEGSERRGCNSNAANQDTACIRERQNRRVQVQLKSVVFVNVGHFEQCLQCV